MNSHCEYKTVQLIAAPALTYWVAYDMDEDAPDMEPIDFFALCTTVDVDTGEELPEYVPAIRPVIHDGGVKHLSVMDDYLVENIIGMFRGSLKVATSAATRAQRDARQRATERQKARAGDQGEAAK